jgi:membrane-bound lytic murein transglycosylase A
MRKTLALLSLIGVTSISPLWSALAQLPSNLPSLPVPTDPQTSPPPVIIEPPPPLKELNIGSGCKPAYTCLGWDEQLWARNGRGVKHLPYGDGRSPAEGDRKALLTSIDHSLRYLQSSKAKAAYDNYPIKEITLDRVRRSLVRFRQLVVKSKSPAQLQAAVRREFAFYKSTGNDGKGTVKFTAYYEPVYVASRVQTPIYQYPVYRLPLDFDQWAKPHPTRMELEGKDGLLGKESKLSGLEMFWFRDRFDAYMVQIQGSAQLELTDGTKTSVGYAGGTEYPWTSIGRELAKDGKVASNGLTMPVLIRYFQQNPQEMSEYLPRWERFVFFRETNGGQATGSIGVPVTAERSIATDKSLMPPGALAIIHGSFPYPTENGLEYRKVSRFVLDQDTGSAIKGPGRVDYFMGTGKLAGDRAGITGGNGQLVYLLLKK